ncbi:transporter [Chryseobacterium formosus]|uniref:Transporter n=1 Tax=Chryseobacterium formosus TaxID=1537363 RepID=A0ABT3XR57_9FLAO|nr:transporter [Chryseobacterium formosus]MCX8524620.1 transporter [Chryseobacterium formosus]
MSKNNNFLILFFCGLLLPIKSYGQKDSIKKFSLLNPVPSSQLREMETDRPGVTESPYTIDAGHFQVENDLGRIMREKSESHQINTLLINQMNVKVGLTNSTAVQIGFQTYGRQSERKIDSDEKIIKHGNGDLTLRIKQNLIGSDSGKFVMAVLPYIKFATSNYEDSRFEGGLIIPMKYKLPEEWRSKIYF